VPLQSFSGSGGPYTNPYTEAHQYSYGAKHNRQVLFTATNGGQQHTIVETRSR